MLKVFKQIQDSLPLTPLRKLAGQCDISVTFCASCHSTGRKDSQIRMALYQMIWLFWDLHYATLYTEETHLPETADHTPVLWDSSE